MFEPKVLVLWGRGGGHAVLSGDKSHKGKYFAMPSAVTFLTLFSIFCFITSCTSTSARVLKSTANFLFFSPSFFSSMSSWKRASCCLHARAMLAAFLRDTQQLSEDIWHFRTLLLRCSCGWNPHPPSSQLSAGKVQECERESCSENDVRVLAILLTVHLAVNLVSRVEQQVCVIVPSSVWKTGYLKFETHFWKSLENIYSLKNPLGKELNSWWKNVFQGQSTFINL